MRVSASGILGDTSVAFIGALMEAVATAAMDVMARESDQTQLYLSKEFAAVWAVLAGFNVVRRPEHECACGTGAPNGRASTHDAPNSQHPVPVKTV